MRLHCTVLINTVLEFSIKCAESIKIREAEREREREKCGEIRQKER